MNLLVKIALMSFGLYLVAPAIADDWDWEGEHHPRHPYHFRHGSYRYPEYREREVSVKETPYGIRRETEEESAEIERGFLGLGEPRLVEKEVKKVEYR